MHLWGAKVEVGSPIDEVVANHFIVDGRGPDKGDLFIAGFHTTLLHVQVPYISCWNKPRNEEA